MDIEAFNRKISDLSTLNYISRRELSLRARQIALGWNDEVATRTFLELLKNNFDITP